MAGSYWDRSMGGYGEGLPLVERRLGRASPTAGELGWQRESIRALEDAVASNALDRERITDFDRRQGMERTMLDTEQARLRNQSLDPEWKRINQVRDLQHEAGLRTQPLYYDTVRARATEAEDLKDIAASREGQRFFDTDVARQREALWKQGLRERDVQYGDPARIKAQADLRSRQLQNEGEYQKAQLEADAASRRESMRALGGVAEGLLVSESEDFQGTRPQAAYKYLMRGFEDINDPRPYVLRAEVEEEAAKRNIPVETLIREIEGRGTRIR